MNSFTFARPSTDHMADPGAGCSFGDCDQVRVMITIAPERISGMR
jgi:hypothetical protein